MERTKTVTNHRGRVNVGVSRVARLEAALAAAGTAKPQDTPFSSLPVALLTMNGYSMDTEPCLSPPLVGKPEKVAQMKNASNICKSKAKGVLPEEEEDQMC